MVNICPMLSLIDPGAEGTQLAGMAFSLLIGVAYQLNATDAWGTALPADPPLFSWTVAMDGGSLATGQLRLDDPSTGSGAVIMSVNSSVDVSLGSDGALSVAGLSSSPTGVSRRVVSVELRGSGCSTARVESRFFAIPGGLTLLPPLLTLLMAMLTRSVIPSLAAGIALGALFLHGYNPVAAMLRTIDTYMVEALADLGHASIVLFTFFLGGLVTCVTRSGGAAGLATKVTAVAHTPMRGQLATWVLGMLIFFDDYANALLVGNAMRPITDGLRISREKLAFLVDASSAPIASIAPISSWIGFELGLIQAGYASLGLDRSPYTAFMRTVPMRFYPINMIGFGFAVVLMRRDFGPMLAAERRARSRGELVRAGAKVADDASDEALQPKEDVAPRAANALVPIGAVVLTVVVGLMLDGYFALGADAEPSLVDLFSAANSFHVLIWAALMGLLVPLGLYKAQGIMSAQETFEVWMGGMKSLVEPLMVLILAWALGAVVQATRLSAYVVAALGDSLDVGYLPTVVFLLSGLVAMATGSSWGTMAVMFPIVFELAWQLGDGDEQQLTAALSSILAGSVFGDHVSPISDTTILSAIATRCPATDHVLTQAPYAFVCALVSVVLGTLLNSAGGLDAGVCILLSWLAIVGFVRLVGRRCDDAEAGSSDAEAGGGGPCGCELLFTCVPGLGRGKSSESIALQAPGTIKSTCASPEVNEMALVVARSEPDL